MKLQKQSIRKIDISLINITDNVRKQYDDIESLARSIERDGQLQPIGVVIQEDGTFNMLYGFRRLNAFLFLINEGKDFNQIEAKITTGDPAIIQLIENIHRKDLRPEEFEDALQALIDSGLTQKEISERLNIRLTRISDVLAAKKTRESLKSKDIDTSEMSTSTVSLLRSIPEEKQKEVTEKVKKKGSTVKAVKEVMREINSKPNIKELEYFENQKIGTIRDKNKKKECLGCKTKSNLPCDHEEWCNKSQEEKPFMRMSVKEFIKLPEIKEVIERENIILQDKCEHCGEEL